jgi:hypothetical protein
MRAGVSLLAVEAVDRNVESLKLAIEGDYWSNCIES